MARIEATTASLIMTCRSPLTRAVRFLAADQNKANLVHAAFRYDQVAIACGLHVAHDASTAGDGPALEFFGFDVEPHQHVWPDRRFDVPDGAVQICNSVGLGPGPTRRRPVRDLAGLRIEAAEIAPRVVGIPDDVVWANRDAPRPALGIRQFIFLNSQRFGIELDDLVRAEIANE